MLKSSYSLTRKLQTKTKQTIIDSDYVTIQITAKDLTAAEAYCHHVHHSLSPKFIIHCHYVHHSLSPCPSFTVTKVHHSLSIIHCHHCPSFRHRTRSRSFLILFVTSSVQTIVKNDNKTSPMPENCRAAGWTVMTTKATGSRPVRNRNVTTFHVENI